VVKASLVGRKESILQSISSGKWLILSIVFGVEFSIFRVCELLVAEGGGETVAAIRIKSLRLHH